MDEKADRLAAALGRLDELRNKIGQIENRECSEYSFAQRFLKFSSATYSRLRAGKYSAKTDHMLLLCEEAVELIEQRIDALAKRAEADRSFAKTRLSTAVLNAFQKAQDDPDCPIVIVLAPTGAGKTAIGRYLAAKFAAVYVEGRQSWKNSYKAFCADVAEAAHHPIQTLGYDPHRAEESMLAALGSKSGVLYIDEANTMGPFIANGIKLIANQTNYTLIIAAIPEMWDEFVGRATNEVKQVLNRTQAVIRFDGLTDGDVKYFMSGCGLAETDLPAAVRKVRDAANDAGAIKVVKRVSAWLHDQEDPTLADCEKAVALVKAGLDEAKPKARISK